MRAYFRSYIRGVIKQFRHVAHSIPNKFGFYHLEDFIKPYIIEKKIEGVDLLMQISDKSARLWYDLYCTDPDWPEMKFIKDNLISPGGVVIECGSHHGCTAILLSKWVGPKGKVIAYEPSEHNYQILNKNLALNGIKNVTAIKAVVGSQIDVVDFMENEDSSMGSSVAAGKWNRGGIVTKVGQVSLAQHALENPTLIKIDTQGYVYQPLVGLKDIIREQAPHLALEIDGKNAINQYGDNFTKIFDLIAHSDYIYFVSFHGNETPREIPLKNVLDEWKKTNNLTKDIHLFAQNRKKSTKGYGQ